MLLYVFAVFLVIDIAFLYYYNDRDFFLRLAYVVWDSFLLQYQVSTI